MARRKAKAAEGKEPWTWRVPGREGDGRLGLLYEPGNWGDLLKGTWAALAARALAEAAPRPLRYLDPFAGAPAYPLVPAADRRLEWLDSGEFVRLQAPWRARGELASAALLVRAAVEEAGGAVELVVFDAEERFRGLWQGVPEARVLAARSGEEALGHTEADLVLVDPYDLFGRWEELVPLAARAARRAVVLLYLYNKSPRGGGHLRRYEALRRALEETRSETVLIGRLPSDILLPRAYHEMVLLGPACPRRLEAELREETRRLASRLASSGAFEGLRTGREGDDLSRGLAPSAPTAPSGEASPRGRENRP